MSEADLKATFTEADVHSKSDTSSLLIDVASFQLKGASASKKSVHEAGTCEDEGQDTDLKSSMKKHFNEHHARVVSASLLQHCACQLCVNMTYKCNRLL